MSTDDKSLDIPIDVSNSPPGDSSSTGASGVRLAEVAPQALPLPGAPGSQPAPYDPKQAPLWQALLAEYESEIAAIGNVPAAAELHYESGRIWEEKLAQPRNAWNAYNRAFQLDPRLIPNIHAARRLASQVGNWNATVNIIDSEIAATQDPARQAYLYQRKALILEEKLGRQDEARQAFEAASRLQPDNVELLRQIERLALAAQDFARAVELRQREIELTEDPNLRVQLLLSAARMREAALSDAAGAEEMYQKALAIDAGNTVALSALRRLYGEKRQYDRLLQILVQETQVPGEPVQVAMLHYQRARILREQQNDPEGAIEALRAALGILPDDRLLLSELASLYESLMRWQELVEVYERLAQVIGDRQELVSLYFKMGNLWEEKLFNEDRAIPHYRKVVELNPNYLPALQALGKLFSRKGMWKELVGMYQIEIGESPDPKTRAMRLYKLSEILEERLGDDAGAMQALEQCLELNPGYLPALKALGQLYTRYNRWESLIQMHEKEIQVTADRDQQVFLLDRIAGLWEEKLNNVDKALETYQRILDQNPNYLPAIRNLSKLYIKADRWADTIRINELEAQLVNDQKQVISLLHRNGEIYEEKLNDKDQAIETYKKVLALAPNYLPALQSLGRLYFIKGRWEDLISMYRQEIEVTQNELQQITLLYKIGELYEEKLVQEDKAIVAYQEVLRIQPGNFPALKALGRIFANKRDWENLLEVLEKEAAALEDPQQKALSLLRAAEIWETHLNRPDKAVDMLQRILQLCPDHPSALRSLVRLYTQGGNWRELLSVHERELAAAALDGPKAELLWQMADIHLHRLNDLAKAAECYEKILSLRPGHLPSLEALERIYLNLRNMPALARVYEAWAARVSDPRWQVSLHMTLADIKENRLQPPQQTGEHHLKALSLDPHHPDAVRSLDLLYHKFGTWAGLRQLYERELAVATTPEEALDLCLRLGDLAEWRLQDPALARHYYQEALRIRPDHLPTIKALKRVHALSGDLQEMIGLLHREGQVTRDPRQAIATLLQAGQIYRDRFNDFARAAECFFRVLEREPREVQAFQALEALLSSQNDRERLAVLYQNRLAVTDDGRIQAELLLKLGGLYAEHLGRPQDAAEAYRRVLQLNPNHVPALTSLAGLSMSLGDWDGAIQLLSRLIELGGDNALLVWAHTQLGILFQEKKPDMDRAVAAFQRVLELEPSDIGSLQQLKMIFIARQQWSEAAEVLGRMAEALVAPAEKAAALSELARIYETGVGNPDMAVQTYRALHALAPQDVTVIQKLGELYERLERWGDLIEAYQAFIRLLPPERAHEALELHLRMGKLQQEKFNNAEKAILEYRKVVELNPRHTEAIQALASLYGRSGLYYANAVEEHRKLLEINPFRIESYHELRRIFQEQRAFDKVFCVCSALHFLRAADPDEEFFYAENRAKVPERTGEQLQAEELSRWLSHPAERGLVRDIVAIAAFELSRVLPPNLDRHGVGKSNRARKDDPVRALLLSLQAALPDPVEFELYISNQPTFAVAIENTEPPSLIVGEGLIKRTNVHEQRFALARALYLLRSGAFLPLSIGAKELARLVAAAVHPYQPNCPLATFPGEGIPELANQVRKALSGKRRRAIEALVREQAPELMRLPDYEGYLRGAEHSANRAGLALSNDLAQAILHVSRLIPELRDLRLNTTDELANAMGRHPAVCELLRFAVSEEYFRLRARLKTALV